MADDKQSIDEYRFWLMFDATNEKFQKVKAEYEAFITALERENLEYSIMEEDEEENIDDLGDPFIEADKFRKENEPEEGGDPFTEAEEEYAGDLAATINKDFKL